MPLFFRTKTLAFILLVAVVVTPVGISISNGIHVQRAQAQMDLGELGKGFVVGAAACVGVAYLMKYLSAGIALLPAGPVPESSGETPIKKALDCILYQVVNTILEDMINSITVWAQSGFEGNPVFATQVQQQMLNVLDNVAGTYIESKAPLLCSPFRAEVQLALMQSYQRSSGRFVNSCSLSEVIGNVDQFLAGDFYAGGFDGWIEMVSTPYGNPYGSYLETQMGLQLKLLNTEGKRTQDLLQGRGFMSKQVQDCYLWPPDGQGPPQPYDETQTGPPQGTVTCDEPRTITPGSFIQEQVGKQLGMSAERLSFADEINEMITAIIAYLIRDVLLGEGGLAGYDPEDFADNEYPELPGVDEFPVDPPGGGGSEVDEPPGEPAQSSECFRLDSFEPSPERPNASWRMNLPADVHYEKLIVEFDVETDSWYPDNNGDWIHEVFYLTRNASWGSVFGYVWARSPDRDGLKIIQRLNTVVSEKAYNNYQLSFGPSVTHHFLYTFDTTDGQEAIGLEIDGDFRAGPSPSVNSINTGNENRFFIELGFGDDSDNPFEKPSMNWKYRDLRVKFLKAGDDDVGGCTPMVEVN